MAINYAPMEPFDARVSESYGASQSRQQAQQMALQAYGITQASSDRASERAQNEEQFNASYRQKFQMQDAAQAHDFAQAQQHTDLQAQLSQTQLNQAEQMRLQRLDRQIEYVQANSGSGGQYTPQEAQEMIGDLRMGRDPLAARAQRAQTLQTQAQTQHLQQVSAQEAVINNRNAAFHARTLSERTQNLFDPQIEAEVRAQLDPDGSNAHLETPGFEEAVHAEITRRGGSTKVFESQPGVFTPLDSRRAADQESRRQHIMTGIQRVDTEIRQDIDKWADPVRSPNAPAWTRTEAGIEAERTRRIDRLHGDVERIFNPQSPRQQGGGGQPVVVGQQGAQMAVPPTGRIPEPGVRAATQPAGVPMDRIRAVEEIARAITPIRQQRPGQGPLAASITGPRDGPIDTGNQTEMALANQMHAIISRAGRESRTLNTREATDYENARRDLEAINPDAARLYSLAPTPEQNAFGHSSERASQLQTLTPLLRDEAGRIFNSTSMTGRIGDTLGSSTLATPGVQVVGRMYDILNRAADSNRRLNNEETTQYLRQWRQLRRLNSRWADRLALHQD